MDDPHDFCPAFLSFEEIRVLSQMSDGDMVYPASVVALDSGVPVTRVRRTFAKLRAMGYADTGHLTREDDGLLAGRGTWVFRTGLRLRDMVRAEYWT